MSDRYYRKDVERAFDLLAFALGKPHAADGHGSWAKIDDGLVAQVGWWELDHAACYGGYVIHEIANKHGGVTCPFGDRRMTAREFCTHVRFAIRVLKQKALQSA